MGNHLWIREEDAALFRKLSDAELVPYHSHVSARDSRTGEEHSFYSGLLTGAFENEGEIGKFPPHFALGRIKAWKSRLGNRTNFVRVRSSFYNGSGDLVMTPHSWINTRFHHNAVSIDRKTGQTRAELIPDLRNPWDIVLGAFNTYDSSYDVKRIPGNERDNHLLVYQIWREQTSSDESQ